MEEAFRKTHPIAISFLFLVLLLLALLLTDGDEQEEDKDGNQYAFVECLRDLVLNDRDEYFDQLEEAICEQAAAAKGPQKQGTQSQSVTNLTD